LFIHVVSHAGLVRGVRPEQDLNDRAYKNTSHAAFGPKVAKMIFANARPQTLCVGGREPLDCVDVVFACGEEISMS
jgi:hypothetical protein